MLSPYRVLDLSDGRGAFCGRVLADLGADVLKLEPPWGRPGKAHRALLPGRPTSGEESILGVFCRQQAEYHPGPQCRRVASDHC